MLMYTLHNIPSFLKQIFLPLDYLVCAILYKPNVYVNWLLVIMKKNGWGKKQMNFVCRKGENNKR